MAWTVACPTVPGRRRRRPPSSWERRHGGGPRGDVWHLRTTEAVRQVLREKDATTQAGFSAELMPDSIGERPILFMDGDEHRRQRTKVARFFAPKTVTNRYRRLMEERADALVADALATAALVAGATEAVGWARSLGLELVLVFEDGGVVSTSPSVIASPSRPTAR